MRRGRVLALLALLAMGALGAAPSRAGAQEIPPPVAAPQLRADVIDSRDRTAVQLGGGMQLPAGLYARIDLVGAAGVSLAHAGGGSATSGRVDVVARFLLDPFQQARWGLSAGGGVSLLARAGDRVRPVLVVVADLERRRTTPGIAPAFQVGLGGGLRVGAALRWGSPRIR